MDFLSSAIENQKRKRADASSTTTTTTTNSQQTTTLSGSRPGMPKFQRRGDVQKINNTSGSTNNTNTNNNITNTNNNINKNTNTNSIGNNNNNNSNNHDDPNKLVQLEPISESPNEQTTTLNQALGAHPTITTDGDTVTTVDLPTSTSTLDEAQRAIILQHQNERLTELAAARLERYQIERTKQDFDKIHLYMIWSLKRYLWVWEQDLSKRSDAEAQSIIGRTKSVEYKDTRTALRPLFQGIKNEKLKNEIFVCVLDIIDALTERDYIKAQQAFYEVAIGNNPWPIGLPKVGIHERIARTKIDPSLIDHLLKDPIIQAYMQALKRLMAYVEKRFPPK